VQIDFHHTATYVLARLAGFHHTEASTIAYASQYVDNSTNKGTIHFDNCTTYERIASAHEIFDVDNNCRNDEDYQVWVPFHFLPGNNGLQAEQPPTSSLDQRLLCTPDSPLAEDMWQACRESKGNPNDLHRLGITSHVYADTFSHQMFAGIKHGVNIVFDIAHIDPIGSGVVDRIEGLAADLLKLGHGGALTDPDLPFLTWIYKNSYRQAVTRHNPDIFLSASRRLFSQYIYYLEKDPQLTLDAHDLGAIEQAIRSNSSSDPARRHQGWLGLLRDGTFSFGSLSEQEMKDLNYAPTGVGSWKFAALGTTEEKDTPGKPFHYDTKFENSDWKKFHDALKNHQEMILDAILPRYYLPRSYDEARAAGL